MTEPMTPERLKEIKARTQAANRDVQGNAPYGKFIDHAMIDVVDLIAEVERVWAAYQDK